eukprot:TRINITY_DN8512_c0_g1_i1.p1 TRINITY_DN8512_c0_g1~~TRINITY_DN8512_c0_g1_i1.p1  ORF type:complete len:463 (-),score=102.68 TRINITY_DN8512_c0_g1_i1:66-1454(-)
MATQTQQSQFLYIALTEEEDIFDCYDMISQVGQRSEHGSSQQGQAGNQGIKGFSSDVSNRQRQQRRRRGGNKGGIQGGQGGNQQGGQSGNQGDQQGGQGNQGGQQVGQGGSNFQQSQGVQGPFGRFVGEALNYSCNPSAAQQPPQSLKEFFQNIPLEAMMIENWIRKRLVLVGDNQPLDKALQHLNRHKITSLPIINEQNGNIIGVVNVLDIVNYLCSVLDSEGFGSARWDFVLKSTGQLMQESNSRSMVISNQASMFDAIQLLSQEGCHRLMVVDNDCQPHQQQGEEKDLLGLMTQSDIIRFLSENPYWLRMCANSRKSLGQLNMFGNEKSKQVLTIEQNQLTRDAFKKMADNNSGGIAIVDDQGRLVAHLSASNVRGLSRTNFQLLNRPVFEFLQRDRRRGWWSMPICLNENDSLDKAILQFTTTRVHQMYICDEQGKPQHVVDLTDIIKLLWNDSPMSA